MPVTNVAQDLDARTITITAEFAAPIERIWQIYADPRQLEKIWGPPTYPATFVEHSLTPGSRITYYMTSPEGDKYGGYWDIISVDEPNGFTYSDGFADENLQPNDAMPVSRNEFTFVQEGDKTIATYFTTYETVEALQQVLDMGVIEGASGAINQIDGLIAS